MIADDLGQQLHDRATRGESLSDTERAHMDEWLAAQDATEDRLLSSRSDGSSLTNLRSQVSLALEQVGGVTRRLQQLSSENDALRQEIAVLHRRLAATAQPA